VVVETVGQRWWQNKTWLPTGIATSLNQPSFSSMMQGLNIDPGSNDFNNCHYPNPFFEVLMQQDILALALNMGIHTPSAKIQKFSMWFNVCKLAVEQQHQTIMSWELSVFFPAGVSYNKRTNVKYIELQANGKFWLQQRVSALETFKKTLIDLVMFSETWVSLMPSNPVTSEYLLRVKNSGANPNEMDSLQCQVALMSVNGKPKK